MFGRYFNDHMMQLVDNLTTARINIIKRITGEDTRDLNSELQYPDKVSIANYVTMYERNGIADRVVHLFPDECWSVDPQVFEVEDDTTETDFEIAFQELNEKHLLWHYLHRADGVSGIGEFGIVLLGFNDSGALSKPISRKKNLELLFLRPFHQGQVKIAKYDTKFTSERFGLPEIYTITFGDDNNFDITLPMSSVDVHWTRVIHLADNRDTSEVLGKPRMRPVYNRLLDLKKLLGGSAEMFWKGALPGYVFEVDPEYAAAAGLDNTTEADAFKKEMKEEYSLFSEGLKRAMSLIGVSVKSLSPQVVAPDKHITAQLQTIAMTLGVPNRVFLGTEEGKLASSQDIRVWNRRLRNRQSQYITPLIIKPLIERLIEYGVLPEPKKLIVQWPDLDILSEQDKADVADKKTTALQKYVTGNIEMFIPPLEYLTTIMRVSPKQAKKIVDAAKKHKPMIIQPETQVPSGGGDNMISGKSPGGQNPRNPAADRSRSGSSAAGNT